MNKLFNFFKSKQLRMYGLTNEKRGLTLGASESYQKLFIPVHRTEASLVYAIWYKQQPWYIKIVEYFKKKEI